MSLQVAPGVGSSVLERFNQLQDDDAGDSERQNGGEGPMKREELRTGAKKAAEYVKDSTRRVVELNAYVADFVRSAVVHKEAEEAEQEARESLRKAFDDALNQ